MLVNKNTPIEIENFKGLIHRLIPKTCRDSKGRKTSVITEEIRNTNDPTINILLA